MRCKQFYRSRNDALLGGVCGGLGRILGISPTWLRLSFILLGLFNAAGWLLYLLLWWVIPSEHKISTAEDRLGGAGSQAQMIVGAGLLGVGLLLLSSQLDCGDIFQWYPIWPLLLICIGGLAVWRTVNEH